jgi:type I restriction enzyme S subunit
LKTNGCIHDGWLVLRKYQQYLNADFFYYLLLSSRVQKQFQQKAQGSTVSNLNTQRVSGVEIAFPPLPDQQRIVSYLDAEFAKIEALKANAEKQLQAAKDLFQAALKELLTPKEGWVEKNITQLAENLDSKRIPITSHLRKKGIYPYYGASGIVDYVADYIFDDDLLLISEDGANLLARSTPIAFSVSGKIWVNNHAHIFKFTNMCTQKYVEYYFASINVSEYVTGAAQPKLAQKMLNRIPISIPDNIKEQKAIVSQLDKIYVHCQSLEGNYTETITLCNDLKQALLKKVFG